MLLAIAALAIGAAVALRRKGDRRHQILGYCFAVSLLLVNASALAVYEDSSGIGPFHVLALVSLVTLASGFIPVLLRRPAFRWLDLHSYFMSWSYAGLVAAGSSQVATMSTDLSPQIAVGLPSVAVVLTAGVVIHTQVPRILAELAPGRRQAGKRLQSTVGP